MGIVKRIWAYLRVLRKARRHRGDLLGWLVRRPQLLVAQGTYESSLMLMGRMPAQLKSLAVAKSAMIVNCEYCLDIGAEIARAEGIPDEKLRALLTYADSPVLSDDEKLVVGFAAAVSASPAIVPDELRAQLEARFTRAQIAELAAEIAWENQRARLNQALAVRPSGFSDGSFCLVPEPAQRS
ncbi:carboxymuconolactone decarboxylase family protein [Nocardioides immobilis]|uniref:Carboxymuconolactone decarboxylase family protein n=1 Tax=Nocardioides immobilis TaxID=2049295 RepID=A0A417XZ21_9ACTN|nr:carboxymuconolactone decarboxylase family protein [Nocardioides immobilis]RHW25607.1 carboxymuconolactone decarboxylase family protein [Nocardioides immobilis]